MPTTSFAKGSLKILLLEGVHPNAVNTFKADGYSDVTYYDVSLSSDELAALLPNFHFLGIRSRTQLTESILKKASRLTAIGCFCIGTNQVDLSAAADLGIPVFNAPYSNTRSVAELVLAEMIMLMRGIPQKSAAAHRGVWQKSAKNSHEIRGKKLGIVGYGHIGAQLSIIAENLGMQVYYYDIEQKLTLGNAEPVSSLHELLSLADVVSLHVPATAETKNMIQAAEFEAMKKGAYLINAARGNIVDIDALCKALEEGKIAGAAIDVFPREPTANDLPFESPLMQFDNVILTPHIGGSTIEAQQNIGTDVAAKLIKYSNNGSTMTATNFPEVALPEHMGLSRILHVHKNAPGVLKQINEVFSDQEINIAGQYLQTNAEIGYVVMDINGEPSEKLLKALKNVEGTLRARVLY